MTRGLVTGGLVLALTAALALPAFAGDDLGAPPAGVAPRAAPVPPPPPDYATRTDVQPAVPPPPPPPPWDDTAAPTPTVPAPLAPLPSARREARRLATGSREPVPLDERYADEARREALAREAAATQPCTPPVRIIRRFGGDIMRLEDPTRAYSNAWIGFSGSFLPNLGAAFEIGGVYERTRSLVWAWEGELTWQFLDDETFADDGNPAFKGWYQVQGGVKISSHPLGRRHWTGRWGGVWFYADGEPNIVQREGHYFGVYAGFGFETDLTCNFTMGPELSGMFVVHESGHFTVVPQFNWHFIWSF